MKKNPKFYFCNHWIILMNFRRSGFERAPLMEGMILITSYKLRITNHGKFDWAFAYGNSITAVYFLMHQHFYFDGN